MLKNTLIWLPAYLKRHITLRREIKPKGPVHIMFCIADHFEPAWGKPAYETEAMRIERWLTEYPNLVEGFRDSDGKCPQHTFFYPEEEYRAEHLEKLASFCMRGFGEVEVHLHHHNDTANGLRQKMGSCKENFVKHGLLSIDKKTGQTRFGFVHGNWALDNSRGDDLWCGVNNELEILEEMGCYADFTMPSAPDISQTQKINSIYYAKDDPLKPKSHDSGTDVEVGGKPAGGLMMVQGPLALNWTNRKNGIFPRIENGEISYKNPPTKERIDIWIGERIHVSGRPEWIFVKAYTHGLQEPNSDMFFNGALMKEAYSYLGSRYNDGENYKLHYVTAREMFNIIKAAESGMSGDPGSYRDYMLVKKA